MRGWRRAGTELVRVTFTDQCGASRTIDHPPGASLMEAAVEHEVQGIEAQCYGAGVCGTCHVIVSEQWFAATGGRSEWEQAMLDALPLAHATSRLSCQIVLGEHLEGAEFTLPERQESLE
jgi:2Fe-2S ferredoxin